ncbi:BTAD domain-containing putative transcriptional regulator [Streptomyces sp. NPDC005799]
MTAPVRTCRVSDALRTYREGREVLREELGIPPGRNCGRCRGRS